MRSLFQFFLLSTCFSLAYAQDITGLWVYNGPAESGMWLKTKSFSNKVHFQLEIARGAPSYNSGWIEGEFELIGSTGIFQSNEHGSCEIRFKFEKSSVQIAEAPDKQECGFGYNVYAEGKLKRKSSKPPKFSNGDPRFGQ